MLTPAQVREAAAPDEERLHQLEANLDKRLTDAGNDLVQYGEITVVIGSIGNPRANELEILRDLYGKHWAISERLDPGDRPFGPQQLWIFRPKG